MVRAIVNQTRSHSASSKKKRRRDFEATDWAPRCLAPRTVEIRPITSHVPIFRCLLAFNMVGILTDLAVFAQLSKVAF
jgi:hypothetical protein